MQPKEKQYLLDWCRTYSLEKGKEAILSLSNFAPSRFNAIENNEEIIRNLVDFVNEANNNSDEFPLYPADTIIISASAALDKEMSPEVLPFLWYGLGLQTGDYDLWEPDQVIMACHTVFSGDNTDAHILVRNIREVAKSEEAIVFCQKFIKEFILSDLCTLYGQLDWYGYLTLALSLDVVYERLPRLSEDEQKDVIQHTLYLGLCLGVDAGSSLKSILHSTKTMFSFISTYGRLTALCTESPEMIIQNADQLSKLWNDYFNSSQTDWSNTDVIREFTNKLIIDQFQKEKIFVALKIIVGLKTGTLQLKNYGDEPAESEEYRFDMIRLIFWFGLGETGHDALKNYFSQKEPKVTISSFIKRMTEFVDLKDTAQVENILTFSELLRELGWISVDDNLIEFHESDSQFHWNEEFLS